MQFLFVSGIMLTVERQMLVENYDLNKIINKQQEKCEKLKI